MKESEVFIKRILNTFTVLIGLTVFVGTSFYFIVAQTSLNGDARLTESMVVLGIGLGSGLAASLINAAISYIMYGKPKIWHKIPS